MRNILEILVVITALGFRTAAQDVSVKSFTITTPSTLTTGLCSAETAYTFNIVVCEVGGTAATVTAVNLHYASGDDYATATTKGGANLATLGASASDISVSANGQASNTGATVTIAIDAACASYTHICAVTTTTNDNNAANDNACIALDGGTTSTSKCEDCTEPAAVENGQKEGDTFAHGDTVTYTCDTNYYLVGEGILTCVDGEWDNSVPTCSDTKPTTEDATTTDIQTTASESGSGKNEPGLSSMIATLTFVCIASFW